MTDRDRFGLRGSVKSCELQRTWYPRGSGPDERQTEERNDVTVVEFRPDGSFERHWHRNPSPNLSEWTSFYEYSDDNRLTTERASQGGTDTITKLYDYDSAGRISRIIMPDKNGQQRVAETYSHDADGRKKKIIHIDPNLPSGGCGTMFGVDGSDAAYGSPGATNITSIYDERGRPIEHLFHDSGGERLTRVHFRYDERGNLVEEACSLQKLQPEMIVDISPEQLEALRMLIGPRRYHRYDEHDRRIETSSSVAPQNIDLSTFVYNDHGDVITEISESSHTEYSISEDGTLTPKPDFVPSHRSEVEYRYQYDPHGNWIEKIAEIPGGPIWNVEHRTISYFE